MLNVLSSSHIPSTDLALLPEQIKNFTDHDVLANLERFVKSERKIMHIVLCHIAEVEKRKLFFNLGYESLYKYLTRHLGYSEDAAYDRMQAARILMLVPEVTPKIEEGSIKLTQLVKVHQCLKQERKLGHVVTLKQTEDILFKLENKTNFETDKVLAIELNQIPKLHQKIKPQSDDSVRVEMSFSKEEFDLIKEAQSLYSHVVVENDLAKLMMYLTKKAIQHKKGKIHQPDDKSFATQSFREKPEFQRYRLPRKRRKYLTRAVRRAVFKRAGYCCEHVDEKSERRCGSKFQLQPDHIIPLACGGSDDLENLRALCGVHNRYEARKWGLCGPPQ